MIKFREHAERKKTALEETEESPVEEEAEAQRPFLEPEPITPAN